MRPDLDRTFQALSDPTRRRVIERLRRRPERAGELSDALAMSPPAMSRHLRVLREAGLVRESALESDQRVRVYELEPEPFLALRRWLDEVESFWQTQLDAFRAHAEAPERRRHR
ncbi:MAG: metalloregulator ArsR/SmtB family transcription factor [Polyangiaceae bacterium]